MTAELATLCSNLGEALEPAVNKHAPGTDFILVLYQPGLATVVFGGNGERLEAIAALTLLLRRLKADVQ